MKNWKSVLINGFLSILAVAALAFAQTGPIGVGFSGTLSSGQFLAPDGTAAAPSYSFSNQTDLGFFRRTAAIMDFSSQGLAVISFRNSGFVRVGSGGGYEWSPTTDPDAGTDLALIRQEAGILKLSNASSGATGAVMQFVEIAAPAAPAANNVRLFSQDNGSGKTQLCAIFATGVVQCFATEP